MASTCLTPCSTLATATNECEETMSHLLTNSFFPIFTIMAFVAVVLLAEALYMLWN